MYSVRATNKLDDARQGGIPTASLRMHQRVVVNKSLLRYTGLTQPWTPFQGGQYSANTELKLSCTPPAGTGPSRETVQALSSG